MSRVHAAYPSKHAYWTEGGPELRVPTYETDWTAWSAKFASILKNWARCIVGWNLVLDEEGKPNIGPFECGGLVTVDYKTQEVRRSGQYWAFAHYSKRVRRGALVVESHSSAAEVDSVAFVHPEGDMVLVLTNQGKARDLLCRVGSQVLSVHLPAQAVVTLQWRS